MKRAILFFVLCVGTIVFYSCSDDDTPVQEEIENPEEPVIPVDPGDNGDDDLDNNSQNVNYENAIYIAFTVNNATIENTLENNGVEVVNSENHIIIRSSTTSIMNIVLSGTTNNGSVKVYGNSTFGLILNGVDITNPNGAAINIQNKEKALVSIIDETNNRLVDGEEYIHTNGEDMKATFFSEGDLEFSGNGKHRARTSRSHEMVYP